MKTQSSRRALFLVYLSASIARLSASADSMLLTDERFLRSDVETQAAWGTRGEEWAGIEPVITHWQRQSFSETAAAPGLGGSWSGSITAGITAGDYFDSECLGEASVFYWALQSSVVEPTHFEAASQLEFLAWTYGTSLSGGELESSFGVTFELTQSYLYDFTGFIDRAADETVSRPIVLRREGGGEILHVEDSASATGSLTPGIYRLEAAIGTRTDLTTGARGSLQSFSFKLNLSPRSIPDAGSTWWYVLAGLLGLGLAKHGEDG